MRILITAGLNPEPIDPRPLHRQSQQWENGGGFANWE
jgi:hypothetical protein